MHQLQGFVSHETVLPFSLDYRARTYPKERRGAVTDRTLILLAVFAGPPIALAALAGELEQFWMAIGELLFWNVIGFGVLFAAVSAWSRVRKARGRP